MSKNVQGYMGTQVGKLGPAVGRRFRGTQVYSAYQKFVRNPKSSGQRLIRARFAELASMTPMFAGVAAIGFKNLIAGTTESPRNAFMKANWDNVTASTPEEVTVNYANLQLSKGGALPNVNFGTPNFETEGKINVGWDAMMGPDYAGADDKVVVFVYQPDTKQSIMSTGMKRSDRQVDIDVPSAWSGQRVQIWGFATGDTEVAGGGYDNRGMIASTMYIGNGEIA